LRPLPGAFRLPLPFSSGTIPDGPSHLETPLPLYH